MTTPQHPTAQPFDARPLTEPVDRAAVKEFARQLRASGALSSRFSSTLMIVFVVAFVVIFLVVGGVISSVTLAIAASGGVLGYTPLLMLGFIVATAVIAGGAAFARRGSHAERWYRLDRFARANGMVYVPEITRPQVPGMIFGVGDSRKAIDIVRGTTPRFVEFANYSYTTGSGDEKTTHKWGYVAVRLDVPLPHIVLDALSNNGLFGGTNLPTRFSKGQRLSLEGDFDRYFSLYCPQGYERDALYLFTPDIMARLIDNAAALDIEIIDDWLFLYAKRDFSTLDPAMWAWLFSVVGALLDKLAQWARWRDERLLAEREAHATWVAASASQTSPATGQTAPFTPPLAPLTPPPGVAAPGRRLQRRTGWFVAIPAVAIIFWVLTNGFRLFF